MKTNNPADEKDAMTPEQAAEQSSEEAAADAAAEKLSRKDKKESKKERKELEALEKQLAESHAKQSELEDKYLRMLAEYENFRRRAKEEMDAAYATAAADVLASILPVIDNLERAAAANGDVDSVRKGVQMTLTQFTAALDRLGITEVPYDSFDPNLHNAVMHVEDETKGEGEIVEVLQRGYKKGDKIIRYAMVKVAN